MIFRCLRKNMQILDCQNVRGLYSTGRQSSRATNVSGASASRRGRPAGRRWARRTRTPAAPPWHFPESAVRICLRREESLATTTRRPNTWRRWSFSDKQAFLADFLTKIGRFIRVWIGTVHPERKSGSREQELVGLSRLREGRGRPWPVGRLEPSEPDRALTSRPFR